MAAEPPSLLPDEIGTPSPASNKFPRVLAALRHYDFRLFWFGQLISLVGTWMQVVGQGWLVLQLTNSPLFLGLVSSMAALPVLVLSPLGGVLADRFNKRKLIVVTQLLVMTFAFVLAALVLTGRIRYWQILTMAFCSGTVMALDAPSRQSFVIEMVGKQDLLNAIALNSSIFNTARIVGPAIAGIIIGAVGVGLCYLLNGLSFIPVIIGLLLMKGNFDPAGSATDSFIKNLADGITYVRRDRRVLGLLSLVASASIFIMPYVMLMPIFARDVLKVGPRGYGALLAAAGTGALVGALTLATLGDFKRKGRLVLIGTIVFCIAALSFTFSTNYHLSLFLLVFVGWGMVTQNASINSLLQTMVADHMRGRIMSLYTMTFLGMMPLGSLLAGFEANYLGARWALRIGGIAVAVIVANLYRTRRAIFEL